MSDRPLASSRSAPGGPRSRCRLLFAAVALVVAGLVVPGVAGTAQSSGRLDELKEERRRAQAQAASQAGEVDAASAEVDELTAALEALQTQVNATRGRLDEAERNLDDAESRRQAAEIAVAEQRAGIETLRLRLADRAVESFVNRGDETNILVRSEDPNEAVRMQALIKNVTRSEVDVVEALRAAEEDLLIQERLAAEASIEAAGYRDTVESELAALDDARAAQVDLTEQAESRLDAELAELASISELDSALASRIALESQRLAEELARKARPPARPSGGGTNSGGGSGGAGGIVGAGEIVSVRGIMVHRSIADNVERLLGAAAADGINLAGGGYRSADGQIAVRRRNCGSSDYAVWQMPPSQCRPPTARPGRSQHERGLAIDFTYNGRLIRSRSDDGFRWLAANASAFGLYNLPSEPWHWSTNGN